MSELYNTDHGTVVNCMDGTIQLPVIEFAKRLWKVGWVDMITDAAPEKILFEAKEKETILRIHQNIKTSLREQKTKHLAIVSHSGCDTNKAPNDKKVEMLHCVVGDLKKIYQDTNVIGIWIDEEGRILKIEP